MHINNHMIDRILILYIVLPYLPTCSGRHLVCMTPKRPPLMPSKNGFPTNLGSMTVHWFFVAQLELRRLENSLSYRGFNKTSSVLVKVVVSIFSTQWLPLFPREKHTFTPKQFIYIWFFLCLKSQCLDYSSWAVSAFEALLWGTWSRLGRSEGDSSQLIQLKGRRVRAHSNYDDLMEVEEIVAMLVLKSWKGFSKFLDEESWVDDESRYFDCGRSLLREFVYLVLWLWHLWP